MSAYQNTNPAASGDIDYETLLALSRGAQTDAACPCCGPSRKSPTNRVRKVLRIWNDGSGFLTYVCQRCGESGWAKEASGPATTKPRPAPVKAEPAPDKTGIARFLWEQSLPASGSPVEVYLRSRSCWVLSPTIRYLPARGVHAHAMITPYGIPSEPEYGAIAIDDVRAVHLTKLNPDGSAKVDAEKQKISIGKTSGFPIALAPVNDGLGLSIAEGVEDALSSHILTGRGAWASGGAQKLPALADAVPSFVESVSIYVDNNDGGRRGSDGLALALHRRGIEVLLVRTPETEAVS